MIRKVRFFKQDGKWYADVPQHSLEDNEMVMGAECMLEMLRNNRPTPKDELHLTFTDRPGEGDNVLLHLVLVEHDSEGGWYSFDGPLHHQIMMYMIQEYNEAPEKVWICNVTHDIFGEHPIHIYLLNVE